MLTLQGTDFKTELSAIVTKLRGLVTFFHIRRVQLLVFGPQTIALLQTTILSKKCFQRLFKGLVLNLRRRSLVPQDASPR